MIYSPRWQHLYKVERRRIPPTPEGDLRLHRLERPLPWPEELWPMQDHIERYHHIPPFIKRYAMWLGVPPEQVVIGAGSESLIRDLVMLSCDPGDGFAYPWPTCAMFDVYAQVFQAKPVQVITDPKGSDGFFLECLAGAAAVSRLLLMPNPCQPVEKFLDYDELFYIASECHRHDCVFAIDEAYFGFGAPTALPLINQFDNVLILRTFSKAFGAAGLRVGCAIGQERVVKPLEAIRLSGEIAGPSLRAATRLLAHWDDIVKPGMRDIANGREWLRCKLREMGFDAYGQWANHVLLDLKAPIEMQTMRRDLELHGIHVKGDFPRPLDQHILITAGPIPLMEHFLEVFVQCQKEMSGLWLH